jgi:hypothetical protein
VIAARAVAIGRPTVIFAPRWSKARRNRCDPTASNIREPLRKRRKRLRVSGHKNVRRYYLKKFILIIGPNGFQVRQTPALTLVAPTRRAVYSYLLRPCARCR